MRGAPAEAAAREKDERGPPAVVAAGDKEGRETPKSEKGREEDDNFFGPMGREEKFFWGKEWRRARLLAWGELRGKEDVGGR